MEKQQRKQFQDPALTAIAKKFMQLPPMFDLGQEVPDPTKHINIFPGNIDNRFLSVRFTFRGRLHSVAYGYTHRAVDLCRFADAMTVHLWKYRLRAAPVPGEEQFNFSLEDAYGDMLLWEQHQPEYIDLMYEIENHLLFMGSVTPPEQMGKNWEESTKHNSRARRSAAGRMAAEFNNFKKEQQIYVDLIGGAVEEMQRSHADILRELRQLRAALGAAPAPLSDALAVQPSDDPLPEISDKALASLPIVPILHVEPPTSDVPPAHQAVLDNFHRRDEPPRQRMLCEVCHRGPPDGPAIFRANPPGQLPAVWRCAAHQTDAQAAAVDPQVREIVEAIERPAVPDAFLGTINICRCDTPRPIWLFDHRLCSSCGWRYVAGKSQPGNFVANPKVWDFLRNEYCPECGGQLATDGHTIHCLSNTVQGRRIERSTGRSCNFSQIVLNENDSAPVDSAVAVINNNNINSNG